MPQQPRVYTRSERRIAVWVLLAAIVLAGLSGVLREMLPPSLGAWNTGGAVAAPPGVIDARPLASTTAADALA